ncbi:MAG: hypothetical protein LBH76_09825 [Propionibacteriaceae bacterium]|nr:hypothetical protein [Propionibacteriaceae bacterium]
MVRVAFLLVIFVVAVIVFGIVTAANRRLRRRSTARGQTPVALHPEAALLSDRVDPGVPGLLPVEVVRVDGAPAPVVDLDGARRVPLEPGVPHRLDLQIYEHRRSGQDVYRRDVADFPLQLRPNQRVTLMADVSRGLRNAQIVIPSTE